MPYTTNAFLICAGPFSAYPSEKITIGKIGFKLNLKKFKKFIVTAKPWLRCSPKDERRENVSSKHKLYWFYHKSRRVDFSDILVFLKVVEKKCLVDCLLHSK